MKLIDKDHINELKELYNNIDNCISDLLVARSRRDDNGIAAAHWQMETLMVNTQQTISYILENLEAKEVDLEKEWKEYFKYRGDVATVNLKHLARHFFELGLKTQKGE